MLGIIFFILLLVVVALCTYAAFDFLKDYRRANDEARAKALRKRTTAPIPNNNRDEWDDLFDLISMTEDDDDD